MRENHPFFDTPTLRKAGSAMDAIAETLNSEGIKSRTWRPVVRPQLQAALEYLRAAVMPLSSIRWTVWPATWMTFAGS